MKLRKILFSVFFMIAFFAMSLPFTANSINIGDEITYLHTDRTIYVAGENIFFKLYLVDAGTHKLSGLSRIAYLVLRNNSNIPVARIKLNAEGGIAYGSIFLPDSLKSGTYQITVFTNWMKNAGEATYFTKEIFIANRFDKDLTAVNTFKASIGQSNESAIKDPEAGIPLKINTDKTEYRKREKIKLSLFISPDLVADSANLSVSVSEDVPGISNDFSLENYLKPMLESYVSSRTTANKNYTFLPEQKAEIIQGKVIDQDINQPVPNMHVFLSAADTVVNLQYTVTDTSGMFRFQMNDYYYGKELYFGLKDIPVGRHYKISPEDKFDIQNRLEPRQLKENILLVDYILKSQDIVTIQKTYEVKPVSEINPHFNSNYYCPQLFYKPGYRILPADFVPLDNFAEMAKEIIPPQLSLKKRNDTFTASMADENLHQYMDEEPVVFLDGVLISDVNQLIKLGSDKVKRVELVCSRFNCGELIFPGILAVFSKDKEIENVQINSSSFQTQLEPFHLYSTNSSQSYTWEVPGTQPDFRQLLYWNPDLAVSNSQNPGIEFYASDHTGNFTIRIEGITSGGVPVSLIKRIKVK